MKNTKEILLAGTISENDLRLIVKRANVDKTRQETLDILSEFDDSFLLSQEQNKKGIDWLRNEWKTPRGIERKNNPFGAREEAVLEGFTHFTFDGLYDAGNYQHNWYVPIYTARTGRFSML